MPTFEDWTKECEKWKVLLDLENEVIEHKLEESFEEIDTPSSISKAYTSSMPEYHSHIIQVSEKWLNKATPEDMKMVACHEIAHILTANVWTVAQNILSALPKSKQETLSKWYTHVNEDLHVKLTALLMKQEGGEKYE